jgi:hypothetical protein
MSYRKSRRSAAIPTLFSTSSGSPVPIEPCPVGRYATNERRDP